MLKEIWLQVGNFWILLGILVVIILLQAAGVGLAPLVKALLNRISGTFTTINLEGGAPKDLAQHSPQMAERQFVCDLIDPEKCIAHRAVIGGIKRNEADIAKLDNEFSVFKTALFEKLNVIEGTLTQIRVDVATQNERGKHV